MAIKLRDYLVQVILRLRPLTGRFLIEEIVEESSINKNGCTVVTVIALTSIFPFAGSSKQKLQSSSVLNLSHKIVVNCPMESKSESFFFFNPS